MRADERMIEAKRVEIRRRMTMKELRFGTQKGKEDAEEMRASAT